MTWSLALALVWTGLLVPVGYVLGRALRRVDDRDAGWAPVEAPVGTTAQNALPAGLDSRSGRVAGGVADPSDALSRHA